MGGSGTAYACWPESWERPLTKAEHAESKPGSRDSAINREREHTKGAVPWRRSERSGDGWDLWCPQPRTQEFLPVLPAHPDLWRSPGKDVPRWHRLLRGQCQAGQTQPSPSPATALSPALCCHGDQMPSELCALSGAQPSNTLGLAKPTHSPGSQSVKMTTLDFFSQMVRGVPWPQSTGWSAASCSNRGGGGAWPAHPFFLF